MILLCGEISSNASVDYQKVVRDTVKHIGYDDSSKGMSFLFMFVGCVTGREIVSRSGTCCPPGNTREKILVEWKNMRHLGIGLGYIKMNAKYHCVCPIF